MKILFVFLLLFTFLDAYETLALADTGKLIEIEDKSGLSDDEVREIAESKDEIEEENAIKSWEELTPEQDEYDWIQTNSGEWFKGTIKSLYDGKLEFKSSAVGLQTFSFCKIQQIKSYNIIKINIGNLTAYAGILRLKDDKIRIIQGDKEYEFSRKDLVSFAPDEEEEKNFWSAKVTLSLDFKSGNTNQLDYNSKVSIQRRTAESRVVIDYMGRMTSKNDKETANNQRFNEKYDIYMSKTFFITPVFSEFYRDVYKNIHNQITLGVGGGITLLDTSTKDWTLSGGPAILHTRYNSVFENEPNITNSPALVLSTHYVNDINKYTDIVYDYKLTITDSDSGIYKHHMVLTFQNKLSSWLDLDISGVWDIILDPEETWDGKEPSESDFQLLIGLGVKF